MKPRWRAVTFVLLLIPVPVCGHDGPPYPLLVDQQVGPYKISVWADPDVGDGTFFIIPSAPIEGSLPADLKVQVGVQPTGERLPEAIYPSEREDLRDQVQFKSVVKFDKRELWRVRVQLLSSDGSGEVFATVEPTPPGYGRWDLLIYIIPFLAIGFLWLIAIIRRRRSGNS